jgi:hypothetical protein
MIQMPDDSGDAAMHVLGVIPNVYFDLIGRVMPGLPLLFGISQVGTRSVVNSINTRWAEAMAGKKRRKTNGGQPRGLPAHERN